MTPDQLKSAIQQASRVYDVLALKYGQKATVKIMMSLLIKEAIARGKHSDTEIINVSEKVALFNDIKPL